MNHFKMDMKGRAECFFSLTFLLPRLSLLHQCEVVCEMKWIQTRQWLIEKGKEEEEEEGWLKTRVMKCFDVSGAKKRQICRVSISLTQRVVYVRINLSSSPCAFRFPSFSSSSSSRPHPLSTLLPRNPRQRLIAECKRFGVGPNEPSNQRRDSFLPYSRMYVGVGEGREGGDLSTIWSDFVWKGKRKEGL